MADHKHFISIWWFIGLLLLIYGVLITGSGIYEYYNPPAVTTIVLASLHAPIWWGALLIVVGAFYTIAFRPKKGQ